jgi:hypothetical protein
MVDSQEATEFNNSLLLCLVLEWLRECVQILVLQLAHPPRIVVTTGMYDRIFHASNELFYLERGVQRVIEE